MAGISDNYPTSRIFYALVCMILKHVNIRKQIENRTKRRITEKCNSSEMYPNILITISQGIIILQ